MPGSILRACFNFRERQRKGKREHGQEEPLWGGGERWTEIEPIHTKASCGSEMEMAEEGVNRRKEIVEKEEGEE